MTVNQRIKELIKVVRISQSEFGRRIGQSRNNMSYILGSNKGVKSEILESICKAFPNVNPTWLLIGEGDMWKDPEAAGKHVVISGTDNNQFNITQGGGNIKHSGNGGKNEDTELLRKEIEQLRQMLKEKDLRLEDKEELIQMYKKMLNKK